MKKHLEILKSWLESSTKFFIDNEYAEILAVRELVGVLRTNEELAFHREAVSYHLYLARFIKMYLKMIKGIEVSSRQLKRIENLQDFETTHPNLLV